MKLTPLIAAASIAAAAALSVPATAQRTVVAVTAGPTGPGWVSYHETHYATDWDGPRYYDHDGPHHGYYSWNDNYYQNCSYRVTPHGHKRDWHCW